MLTSVELKSTREYAAKWQARGGKAEDIGAVLLALLEHIDAITTHNRAMQAALAQFSDGGNWGGTTLKGRGTYLLWLRENPIDLAERALVGDSEVSTTNEN